MPTLQAEQLGDLLQVTLRELGRGKFTEIATDLQELTAMSKLMSKNQVKLSSGTQVQWDLMIDHSNSARNVGLMEPDIVDISDGMIQGVAPWRWLTNNFAVDAREVDMNREPARIVDLVLTRRIRCMISTALKMEQNWWNFPSASDAKTPFGLPYWVTKTSNTTGGFLGGIPSGYSLVANVSPTTYPRWQNWGCQYSLVTEDDFVAKAREAATKTAFKPPVDGIPTFNTGDTYGFYSNYSVIGQLESLAKAQNENIGYDLAAFDGRTLFRKVPVNYVPQLDADTTGPFYGINWGVMKTYILNGWWNRQTVIPQKNDQHTVAVTHYDFGYQFICKDRRRNFVLATGTTYP